MGDRLRVAHIITRLNVGGAAGFVLDVCRLLPGDAFEPVVVSGHEPECEGSLEVGFADAGVRVIRLRGLRRSPLPHVDLWAAREIVRVLRELRPDVVHTHMTKAGLLGRWAAVRLGLPAVHHIHGWAFRGEPAPLRPAYLALERLGARWCRHLLAVSQADVDRGLALRIGRPEQYRIVHAGIDVAATAEQARRPDEELSALRATHRLVGFIGRLCRQKDPLTFISAAARVERARPGACRFVLVGEGPLASTVDREAVRAGLGDTLVRYPLRDDVPRLLGALDVLVHPSRHEGLPRMLLEAAAAGVPCVATAVDGCGELFAGPLAGVSVPPGDPEATASAILEVLDRGARSPNPAALAEYDIGRAVEELERAYRDLLHM